MDENWIEFEDGPSSSQDRLLVSMNTRAAIFINRAAMDELNHPEAVTLHFDTANDRIGIKSAAPLTPNAFKVVPDKRSRAGRISAVSFAARHEIKFDYNVRFLGPVMYKGMLVVSLNQARRSSRKRNARRR